MLKLSDIWKLNKVRHMLKNFKNILFLTLYTHIYTSFLFTMVLYGRRCQYNIHFLYNNLNM